MSLSVDEAKESNLDVLKRVFSAIGRLENIANNLDESDKFLSGMIAGLDLKDEKLKDVFMQVLEKPENVFIFGSPSIQINEFLKSLEKETKQKPFSECSFNH